MLMAKVVATKIPDIKVPPMHNVVFTCAACSAKFEITSTVKQATVGLDICGECHPVYKGTTGQQVIKGRAEKLSKKFDAGKETLSTPAVKPTKKPRKNTNQAAKSLADL